MHKNKILSLTLIGLLVTGFGYSDVTGPLKNAFTSDELRALNDVTPVGSPFSQKLTEEYRTFANFLQDDFFDFEDALHFARKGLSSARGNLVFPEPVVDWDIEDAYIVELTSARSRLITAIRNGARNSAPALTATAQARYDCWVEETEDSDFNNECKAQFEALMPQIESTVVTLGAADNYRDRAEPAPVVPTSRFPEPVAVTEAPDEPLNIAEALYLIFFDFDSSSVRFEAQGVVDTLVQEISGFNLSNINIVGHADTTGTDKYNQNLGLKRARNVRQALISRGVDPSIISVSSRGENEPLVPTADNVREPSNRRAVITFTQ